MKTPRCILRISIIALALSMVFTMAFISITKGDCLSEQQQSMVQTLWSVFATMFIGLVALWQNKRFKTLSDSKDDRLMMIENERMRLLNLPYFSLNTEPTDQMSLRDNKGNQAHPENDQNRVLINPDMVESFIMDDAAILDEKNLVPVDKTIPVHVICFKNTGNNTANSVRITLSWKQMKIDLPEIVTYDKHEGKRLHFIFRTSQHGQSTLEVTFKYTDIFTNQYEQTFEIVDVIAQDPSDGQTHHEIRFPLVSNQKMKPASSMFRTGPE
jgi:hypothetical protein